MRVLIVELDGSGHHLVSYVRLAIRACLTKDWEVTLLTSHQASLHPSFSLIEKEFGHRLRIEAVSFHYVPNNSNRLSLLSRQFFYYQTVRSSFKAANHSVRFDLVYVPFFDSMDKIVALLGSPFGKTRFVAVSMFAKFHIKTNPRLSHSILRLAYKALFDFTIRSKVCQAMLVTDERLARLYATKSHASCRKVVHLPDVGALTGSTSKFESREALGLSANKYTVLVYGSLSERKMIRTLIESISYIDDERFSLIVAGMPDASVEDMLRSEVCQRLVEDGRLYLFMGFQESEAEYHLFRSADLAWVAYEPAFTGSSGVLYQAISIGVPVLASRGGVIGDVVANHEVGAFVDPTDPSNVAAEINLLLPDTARQRRLSENCLTLAPAHSEAAVYKVLSSAIENRHN